MWLPRGELRLIGFVISREYRVRAPRRIWLEKHDGERLLLPYFDDYHDESSMIDTDISIMFQNGSASARRVKTDNRVALHRMPRYRFTARYGRRYRRRWITEGDEDIGPPHIGSIPIAWYRHQCIDVTSLYRRRAMKALVSFHWA